MPYRLILSVISVGEPMSRWQTGLVVVMLASFGAEAQQALPAVSSIQHAPPSSRQAGVLFSAVGASTATGPVRDTARTAAPTAHFQFSSLHEAAEFYRRWGQRGDWQPLADGALLKQGINDPQIRRLRQLLFASGDYRADGSTRSGSIMEPELVRAVVHFQRRHGLRPDGVVGPRTRRALNISPLQRAAQIELNKIRQQELHDAKEPRFIQVNLPEYRLRYYNQGALELEMKTIIGRDAQRTPELKGLIHSMVVNPGWNVPRGIAYRDILPQWRRDNDYLVKNNLRVVAGFGARQQELTVPAADSVSLYQGSPYLRFWQPPGKSNALGKFKFDFTNDFAVYLHDTPARYLFDRSERALSSGCVRLEYPRLLAEELIADSGVVESQQGVELEAFLSGSDTHRIRFSSPVPLYVTYWTAWLDASNVLNFREDIYQKDQASIGVKSI